MDTSHDQLSFDTVIPSAILLNENIELTAVKLFAFIKGLTKLHGYCYATNEYLAQLMKSTSRAVQNWLVQLKKEGYVDIETEKNGIHWQRRIYISDRFKKSLRREPQFTPPRTTVHPPMNHGSPITKDYSNEDNLKGEEASPPTPPLFSHKRVRMDLEKMQQLEKDFGKEKVMTMVERLDEYADINPKRFKQYACHGAVIRKWIREDQEKGGTQTSGLTGNKEWARKLVQKLNRSDIELSAESIVFVNHGAGLPISFLFKDHGFKDQVEGRLRKMGLTVPKV